MVGTSDEVGTEAVRYCALFGARARAQLSFDLSRAIGSHDWDRAHLLQRTDLRLVRMERVGYFDHDWTAGPPDPTSNSAYPSAAVAHTGHGP